MGQEPNSSIELCSEPQASSSNLDLMDTEEMNLSAINVVDADPQNNVDPGVQQTGGVQGLGGVEGPGGVQGPGGGQGAGGGQSGTRELTNKQTRKLDHELAKISEAVKLLTIDPENKLNHKVELSNAAQQLDETRQGNFFADTKFNDLKE